MQQFTLVSVPHSTRELRLDQVSKFGAPNNQPVRQENKPLSKIPVRVTNRITNITSLHTVNFNNLINVTILKQVLPLESPRFRPSFYLMYATLQTKLMN